MAYRLDPEFKAWLTLQEKALLRLTAQKITLKGSEPGLRAAYCAGRIPSDKELWNIAAGGTLAGRRR
jgi:hypothetical protein